MSAVDPGTRRVTFQVYAESGSTVFVAGTFNGWKPDEKRLREVSNGAGLFKTSMLLPGGRHEYKFIINGEWRADPECPDWVRNVHGTLNSVRVVG